MSKAYWVSEKSANTSLSLSLANGRGDISVNLRVPKASTLPRAAARRRREAAYFMVSVYGMQSNDATRHRLDAKLRRRILVNTNLLDMGQMDEGTTESSPWRHTEGYPSTE